MTERNVTNGRQVWFCEHCGSEGIVQVWPDIKPEEMVNAIYTSHKVISPRCPEMACQVFKCHIYFDKKMMERL